MSGRRSMTDKNSSIHLALVVPFHNEERHLPLLLESLRAQRDQDFSLLFVDNHSTDGSARLVEQCDEVRSGRWRHTHEPRIGKFRALQAAVRQLQDCPPPPALALIDADSCFADDGWTETARALVANPDHGYSYAPIRHVGIDHLPTFATAYAAYLNVLDRVLQQIGWLANGQSFTVHASTAERYLRQAQVTTEIDLRMSLLALQEGRRPCFNPHEVRTSARRTVVNPANFAAWCFYEPSFYHSKDLNRPEKLNLDQPTEVADLDPSRVGDFFARRSLKLAVRHLLPLATFDRSGETVERIRSALGISVARCVEELRPFQETTEYLFTGRFEEMIHFIENQPAAREIADALAAQMTEVHGRQSASDPAT